MASKRYFVYIMTNAKNNVLYTGVTNNVINRANQHKYQLNIKSFTTKYNITKLVYVEEFSSPGEAILREKQIKAGSRAKKLALITSNNSAFRDLTDEIEY